ncbi:predicted protein [Naegleria gruberi]|uniref:Predicted protein n=1 Tax=Naegleria gruberi TaxID=5762 RepID=D2VBE7_NAEGR|nr:uncharacterized protein NAEGRDRAFT_66188 [Naegleria gruberi]EFC45783.1 predicted protein [Naegleria gruberi]|eukprot:XP_002678527.1 predicted protein [Naegleria gruberi strain NEG-M]
MIFNHEKAKILLKFLHLPLTFSPKPPATLSQTLQWTLERYYNLPLYGKKINIANNTNNTLNSKSEHTISEHSSKANDDHQLNNNNIIYNEFNNYEWKSYEEIYCQAQEFQIYLEENCSVEVGDLVLICCPTSEEWVIADLACAMAGLVSIPVDPMLGVLKIKQICELTKPKAILCLDSTLFDGVKLDCSVNIVKIGPLQKRSNFDSKLIANLSEKEDETYLFTLQPTSGSTGNVKLTKRTRSNWLKREGNRETILLINSLSSPSSRSWLWTNLMQGGKVAESSLETLISDSQIVHPTQVSSTPIVWDHISSVVRKGTIKPTASLDGTISWMNTLFGPKCRAVTNTGAGLSQSTRELMTSLFGSAFGDGYGSSETGGIAINGKLLPGVQIKLVDVPEMGYYSTDIPYPRGELYVKTSTMFDGYLNDEKTYQGKYQEWFPTGDIIQLLSPDEIQVIDRKSFTMKLKNGKFVSSTSIENSLKSSKLLQVIVIVEQYSGKVISVVVPNWDLFKVFLKEKGVEGLSKSEMCSSEKCRNEVLKELKRIQLSEGCNPDEILRGVLIKENLFSVEDGSLNPSLKISKLELVSKFSKEFQELNSNNVAENENDSIEKYLKILKDIFGHEVSMGNHWTELGTNSITVTMIANKLNSTFDSQISSSQIYRSITVENLAFELFNNTNATHHIEERTLLLQDIQSVLPQTDGTNRAVPPAPPQTVFMTGSSGFLGAYILDNLTKLGVKVICLIRSSPEKFYSRMEYYGISPNKNLIELVKGDISKPLFGLSVIEFNNIREKTHSIIHSASNVNWLLPYSALRHTNTLPVKTIMLLSNSNIPIHYISSIACAEPGSCETLIPDIPHDPASMGYGTSKWASEYLLSRYSKQDQGSVVIYRPGHLVPTSVDQVVGLNENDFVSVLISGCIKAKAFPPYSGAVEWTSVGTTASLIVQSVMKQKGPLPSEFNIFSPLSTNYEDLYQAILLEGYELKKCNKDEWNNILKQKDNPLNSVSFLLVDGLKGTNLSKRFTSSNIKYLERDLSWPAISIQNIRNWISHLQRIKLIPPPK